MQYPWAVPGQKVVFIGPPKEMADIPTRRLPGEQAPKRNNVYTIRGTTTGLAADGKEYLGIWLKEIINPEVRFTLKTKDLVEIAFWAGMFRPLQKTNIDIFLKILRDVPSDVKDLEDLSSSR